MKHIWINDSNPINTEVYFIFDNKGNKTDRMTLSIAPFYTVFFDRKTISFGPERTAAGYSRIREILVPEDVGEILIRVTSHGVPTYDCDFQDPFFGCDLYKNGKQVGNAMDFVVYKANAKVQESTRYSYQRGFVERYDLRHPEGTIQTVREVASPVLLKGIGDTCQYHEAPCRFLKKYEFRHFDDVQLNFWYKGNTAVSRYEKYDLQKEFVDLVTENGWTCCDYSLEKEYTGLLTFEIDSDEEDVQAFAVYNEYLDDGKWVFGRGTCCDIVELRFGKGKSKVITSVPYATKFIRVLVKKKATIVPGMILIQNDRVERKIISADPEVQEIYDAALNTYRQNAVDVYTDCPGRERAGWLCDSYFTAMGEYYFTGKNEMERCFLENIILSKTPEIEEDRMVPMCFPSEHFDHNFIPNWAMWFVLEIDQYNRRNNDPELVRMAKRRVYDLVDYFRGFENEEGLLENLEKWVFVEWSVSNDAEYLKGINFPSNMLYAKMLETVDHLYDDKDARTKAGKIRAAINRISFDGKYYCDNAIREQGKIVPQRNHVSETCQYYALYLGTSEDEEFAYRMLTEFSPKIKENRDGVGKSNVFIGYFVRFLWLMGRKEYSRFIGESKDYFLKMAELTGTLWEKDNPSASCNHGFTCSVAAMLGESLKNI